MDLHGKDEDHQHLEEEREGRREPGREAPQVRRGLVEVPRAVRLESLARNFGFQARLSSDFRDLGPRVRQESTRRVLRATEPPTLPGTVFGRLREKLLVCEYAIIMLHFSALASCQKHCATPQSFRQSEFGNALQLNHTFASSHRKQAY